MFFENQMREKGCRGWEEVSEFSIKIFKCLMSSNTRTLFYSLPNKRAFRIGLLG